MAKSRYMTIAPHNPNAGVSTAASVYLCAGLESLEVLEHMSRNVPWGEEVVETSLEVSDGTIEVPDEPGLGVSFNPDAARDHPANPRTATVSSTRAARWSDRNRHLIHGRQAPR